MKLLTFIRDGQNALGVKTEQGVVDIAAAVSAGFGPQGTPTDVMDVISGGQSAVAALQQTVDQAIASDKQELILDESNITFGPSVTKPSKIICVGLNYRKHAEETKAEIPTTPILFNKFSNTLTGHGHDIPLPRTSQQVDYEVELTIVMGKKAKYVSREDALSHVFGYSTVNDVSARDLQLRTQQWLLGKSCDSFSPLGPYLVSADEVGNPNDLQLTCIVNGEERQNSNTSDMIFHCDEIVSYISQHMTLEPGDIILTGTPFGVILGYPKDQRVYLKDGDIVTVEVEKLGACTNRFVNEA
ncbi:fumarylacetoacetate hydrolase family protein [Paenibacillus contaminans]|uniref:FAA hydrolase family protein n=1 Tax=Paenibacillus contaminans TaxID=450362 RepID=A0A329MV39_9BACL|nr:fumarylacetoacetate hydrolase family protein [Paenibacillus contaminans]RAV21817.1 FAA hydrolase family protein [Paenibacillus contaminans]